MSGGRISSPTPPAPPGISGAEIPGRNSRPPTRPQGPIASRGDPIPGSIQTGATIHGWLVTLQTNSMSWTNWTSSTSWNSGANCSRVPRPGD